MRTRHSQRPVKNTPVRLVESCPALGLAFSAVLSLVWAATAAAQNPSNSKLSVQIYQQYTPGANQIINGHPRVLKILKTDTAMMNAARDFKAGTPNGKVVVRPLLNPQHFTLTDNPAGAANTWWSVCTAPALPAPGTPDHALIDYVEGPNEEDSCPTFANPTESAWFSQFWQALAPQIKNYGYLPLPGSIAVGNPPGDTNNINNTIAAFVPALRTVHAMGGAWSYHAYTYFYGYDPNGVELSYSLRYRQFYSLFAQSYPDLSDMPMILTEGGAEGGGGGWKVHGDQVTFTNWLTWYDQQLQQDPYLLGITLFEIGNPGAWDSYDVEDVAPWIAAHLQNRIIVPSAPTAVSSTAGPNQVLLQWNGGYGSTSYNVKRAAVSGGPYTTIASPTTTSCTDTGLANGSTYYYVVSGLSSAGESPNSTEASSSPGDGFAINCGGPAIGPYGADAYYTGGHAWATPVAISTTGLIDPAPMAVYQSERSGYSESPSFYYTFIGLRPSGSYNVRLHFAEIYFSNAGARAFNVSINGSQVLSNFDIVATTGSEFKAVIKTFPTTATGTGQIVILFSPGSANYPKVSAIQIISTGSPPPPAPTGLSATAGDAQVSLSWNSSSGASSYNVKRSTTSGGPYGNVATGLTTTSYTNTGLTNGTPYYYVVTAVNPSGESGNSNQASATPQAPTTPPLPPTNLTAAAGNAQISLAWTASSGASSYNVKRSPTNGGPYGNVATDLTTTGYTNTGLTNGTPYYYVVSAVNSFGESGNSNQASATPQAVSGYAINSGGGAVGSFAADDYYSGTTTTFTTPASVSTTGVTNPAPMALYQTERAGNPSMTYTFPNLAPGVTCTVRLHFAEVYFGGSGQRAFNVSINGTQVLNNFDIYAAAGGQYKAIVREFSTVANGSGQVVIQYTQGSVNNPKSSGIEIIPAGPPPSPTISLSRGSFTHSLTQGESLASDSFTVQNSGGGTLSYSIGVNQSWLSVNPTSGTSAGEAGNIAMNYATASLAPGTYNATITVSDPNATNNPQTISVGLTVQPPAYTGDFDEDGDVDQADFGHLQACLSGTGMPASPDCLDADLNNDTVVDLTDVLALQACMNGTGANPPSICRK